MAIPLKPTIKFGLLVFLVISLLWAQATWNLSNLLTPEQIRLHLSEAGSFAPLLFILAMAAAVVISPIPSLPMDIAAGAFFGPFLGTIYAAAGALIGSILSFLIARSLGRELLEKFLTGHINFCSTCSNKLLTKIILLSRLIPVISFDIVSYGAGLTKISLFRFSIATFFGMLPLTFIYNFFDSVLIFNTRMTAMFGALLVVLFFLIPRWIERYNLFSLQDMVKHSKKKSS